METMNYTHFTLIGLGLLGMLLHSLVELHKINTQTGGKASILSYLNMEKFSLSISVIMVFVCAVVSQEIKQIQQAANWIGLAFVAIGYMGQSLLVVFIGKANKIIGDEANKTDNTNNPT